MIERSPALPPDDRADYPTLAAHGDSRRRFLKLCALSGAAATLGFQLTGCPSSGGGGGGGGGTAVGGGGTDWIPWQQEEPMIMGDVAIPMGKPVGVVAGGGPIKATFEDGATVEIVVAGIMTPEQGVNAQAEFGKLQAKHTQIVQTVVKKHPSSVLTKAAELDALEAELNSAIGQTLSGGWLEQVSVAKKAAPEPEAPKKDAAPAMEEDAAMDSAEPMGDMAAPADALAQPRQPKAQRFWTTCRTPGCKTCG